MTAYTLTLQIDATDLPTLQQAGEQIVIVRRLADAGRCVTWAVITLAPSHTVSWNDDYALYASNTPNATGNLVAVAATTPVTWQCDYRYTTTGFQGPVPDAGLGTTTVQLVNQVPAATAASVLGGLAQSYAIDGGAAGALQPLNAQTVPAQQITQFTASQALWVYLASGLQTGMIVGTPATTAAMVGTRQVFSPALLLQFSAAAPNQTARYSSTLGSFYATSG
ncbi:hypothetical protein [Tahibacter caeni]|uniref:hypothetical protein n=1 Tax=Tahibacter caeni TaxID=1453545 RepID=UPI0021496B6C|nr:hypothetical protein [Tahibacter caeni]